MNSVCKVEPNTCCSSKYTALHHSMPRYGTAESLCLLA